MNAETARGGTRFPAWAHVPGITNTADTEPLEQAKATVPPRFADVAPAGHPAFRYGVALCDAGFYWEAHEVWEAFWMATAQNGRDRQAVRALIQLANAGLKLRMGRRRAVRRLLVEARFRLEDVGPGRNGPGIADQLDCLGLARAITAMLASVDATSCRIDMPRVAAWLTEK